MQIFRFFQLQFIAPGSAAAKYFTAYACNGTSATYTTSTETAGTMCCPIAGGACAGTCAAASTWSTAVLSCALNGMRLCSRGELLDELCCGQGDTTCDTSAVWTLTVEGGKIFILLSWSVRNELLLCLQVVFNF